MEPVKTTEEGTWQVWTFWIKNLGIFYLSIYTSHIFKTCEEIFETQGGLFSKRIIPDIFSFQ